MRNREFLMLGQLFDESKHSIAGKYVSEKLDGIRCFWDGGISRGLYVEWSNDTVPGTGLWTRYGKVIRAPEWWIKELPVGICLDGELYCGVQGFQKVSSYVRKHNPVDSEWQQVEYRVFDCPDLGSVLQDGRINNQNDKREFRGYPSEIKVRRFEDRYRELVSLSGDRVRVVEQTRLSDNYYSAKAQLKQMETEILENGGEGLILRSGSGLWVPKRTQDILKIKPFDEDIGTIIGIVEGEGRLQGTTGAVIVSWKGKVFRIGTGFSDSERMTLVPGQSIRFRYRGLTEDGIPREGRGIG